MIEQLTDPVKICEHAIWHLGDRRGVEGTLGLAAFNSPLPFADVSLAQPGVWAAFCDAKVVVDDFIHQRGSEHRGRHYEWSWNMMHRTNDEREAVLREAADWLRQHYNVIVLEDDEVEVVQYTPRWFRHRLKDPSLQYLGRFPQDTAEESLAEGHRFLQGVADRKAFEAGDPNFEEVTSKTCGVVASFVRRKEGV